MIKSLQNWFASVCDGQWEHEYGIKIETVDNPGWYIQIDLAGTGLAEKKYECRTVERGDNDWFKTRIEDARFIAGCGPCNLAEVIAEFTAWANINS